MYFEIQKIINKGGYLYALVPNHPNATKNGYVLAHRVIVENHLGRLLTSNEIVHHIDGNKHHNDIINLKVMTQEDHVRMHKSTGRTIKFFKCPCCGKIFTKELRQIKKGRQAFCSRSCNGKYQRKHNWHQ